MLSTLDIRGVVIAVVTLLALATPLLLARHFQSTFFPSGRDLLRRTHHRVGLRKHESNLKDQHSITAHSATSESDGKNDDPTKPRPACVQSLVVYPIKSCRPIELSRSRVLPAGLEFDRLFMFAHLRSSASDAVSSDEGGQTAVTPHQYWSFVTQRQFPLLATVEIGLWLPNRVNQQKTSPRDYDGVPYLTISFPWKDNGWRGVMDVLKAKLTRGLEAQPRKEIILPAAFPSADSIKREGYTFETVKIWKETIEALNMEKVLPPELSRYLGSKNQLALFRVNPGELREVGRGAPEKSTAGYQPVTGFQDAFPLHIINIPSHQDFAAQIPEEHNEMRGLDILRYRPNIISTRAPAYDEETWKQIRCKPGTSGLDQDVLFHVSCRTVRCKMPNVDQVTGSRHPVEPDRSLRKLRAVDEGAPRYGCLGMQMTPLFNVNSTTPPPEEEEEGKEQQQQQQQNLYSWIGVGMEICVEERGDHLYVPQ